MVYIRRFLLITFVLLFSLSGNVFASKKEELIIALNKTYYVGQESYTLPEDVRVTAINYLRTHYFTEEECAEIISCINDAVAFANKLGTTDISKISADDLQIGINYAYKAIAIADKAPTIAEMEAKLEAEKQEKKEEVKEPIVEKNEVDVISNKVTVEEKVDTSTEQEEVVSDTVPSDNIETEKSDSEANSQEDKGEIVYEEDEIDYSKYLTDTQFVDADFEELKTKFIGEAKTQSVKIILPYIYKFLLISILIIIFFVIILLIKKKLRRKSK